MGVSLRRTVTAVLLTLLLALYSGAALAGHGEKAEGKLQKPAIMLVAFGTSVEKAQASYDTIAAAYKKAYPDSLIVWAYTSGIIRAKLAKEGKPILSPAETLAALMAKGVKKVVVQSLHIIPGEEWHELMKVVQGFQGMEHGFRLTVGLPLCSTTDDLKKVVDVVTAGIAPLRRPGEAVVFMGHGTPHPAGAAYPALAYMLAQKDPLLLMGTVEGYPDLDGVRASLKEKGVKKVLLMPFMVVAGDHAMNDMSGPEPDSWASVLKADGLAVRAELKPLTVHPKLLDLWLEHTREAMEHMNHGAGK